jgi:uncharacterized ion transporter superfamily protein YfcC
MPNILLIRAQELSPEDPDMIIILLVIAFIIVSATFIIAAGMLSSRLSRQEEWIAYYEEVETVSVETPHQTAE